MATPTSSSNRSKRKTKKPVTQGQDPQRANRQKVSNANVTNSTQRTNNGTAKVTTGRGTAKPPALPPGNRGGQPVRSTAKPTTTTSVQQVRVRDLGSAAPKPVSGSATRALPPGQTGGALARAGQAVSSAVKGGRGLAAGPLSAAVSALGSMAIDGYTRGLAQAIRTERGQQAGASGQSGRYVPGSQQVTPPTPKPKAKPSASKPAPTQSGGGSTQSRSSSGGGTSRPAAPRPQSSPASNAGMKNQDPKFRGNLFEKTFGYKPGQAPDQQKARFKSVDNKFGQDSSYEPKTKVDGSKYADKKTRHEEGQRV